MEERQIATKLSREVTENWKHRHKHKNRNRREGKLNFSDFQDIYGKLPPRSRTSWSAFVRLTPRTAERREFSVKPTDYVCSAEVVHNVTRPMLSHEEFGFCTWALTNGGVKVGISYGLLNSEERNKYEAYYCNSVNNGRNPSCDDAFGDEQIRSWRSTPLAGSLCRDDTDKTNKTYTSNVRCFNSRSNARFCVLDNALMDFTKMHDVHRVGTTDSRRWDKGFLSAHCAPRLDGDSFGYYGFYSPTTWTRNTTCSFVFEETVLVISHDQIKVRRLLSPPLPLALSLSLSLPLSLSLSLSLSHVLVLTHPLTLSFSLSL